MGPIENSVSGSWLHLFLDRAQTGVGRELRVSFLCVRIDRLIDPTASAAETCVKPYVDERRARRLVALICL